MSLSVTGRGHTIWEAAKQEWTKHICNLLVPVIEEGFRNIYTNCEKKVQQQARGGVEGLMDEDEANEGPVMGAISLFKKTLLDIPKWNQEIIDQEFDRILSNDDCRDVLDDLVKAAFTSHILILTSVNLSGQANKKVEMNIPSSKRFVHKIYIEAARVFYRNPHLFVSHYGDPESEYRYHKNGSRIEQILCASVEEAIRKLMPIRTILRAYMSNSGESLPDPVGALQEVEDITRRVSPRSRRGLRNILKSYIQTTSEVIERQDDEDEKTKKTSDLQKRDDSNELDELPWPARPSRQKDEDDEEDEDDVEGNDDERRDSMVVEHVARGGNRRDSLLRRRISPQRSPRPRYRSPTPPSRSHHRKSEDDDHRHRRRRKDSDEEEEYRSHRYDDRRSRRDRDRDRDRDRRKYRYEEEEDDRRRHRRDRDRDDKRSRHHRDRDYDRDRHRNKKDERDAAIAVEADDYAFDLLTLAEEKGKDKSKKGGGAKDEAPSMNIEKRPSKGRPRSVEFRLEMSDEEKNHDEDDGDSNSNKKRVTYKATHRGDQAFFPELEDRRHAPPRAHDLPPMEEYTDDDENDGRYHSA